MDTLTAKELTRTSTGKQQQYPVKVLQFGEGNFLRAFTDWMIDIINEKTTFGGAVDIVQPIGNGMADLINNQDGLYHVVLNGIVDGKPTRQNRLITCINKVYNPYQHYDAYLKGAENPELQFIISNTTEAGIAFDATDKVDSIPNSFPGKLTQFLYHRFKHFKGAIDRTLIFLPCELIDKNGEKLKATIFEYITHWNLPKDFSEWMHHHIFCNTLVDRIVPGFPKDNLEEIQQEIGFNDKIVVTAEPFHLWVIETTEDVPSHFPAIQAGLNVKFVSDLSPYRNQKVHILNGAHTSMVPVAYLQGLKTVRESVEHSFTGTFIKELIEEEIISTLDLPQTELQQFADNVLERFKNPYIRHELMSIALNSISKFKVRVLPCLLTYLERKGTLPRRLVFAFASLIRFYKGEWNGSALALNDNPEILKFFKEVWATGSYQEVAHAVLANTSLWDQDLTTIPTLKATIAKHLETLDTTQDVQASWVL